MKRKVVHESKNQIPRTPHPIIQAPSKENFEKYFDDFYKMFQHCKYNLVALNKKFDALENFFKKYVQNDNVNENVGGSANLFNENSESRSDSYEYEKVKTNKKPVIKKRAREVNEESFPISVEDLDFLTKNYINGTNDSKKKNKSSSKKKNESRYDVIVINKKKMVIDDEFESKFENKFEDKFEDKFENKFENKFNDNFKDKFEDDFEMRSDTNKDIDEIILNEKNNFNQKLFDYKNFNLNANTIINFNPSHTNNELNLSKKKEENLLKTNSVDDSKWISKQSDKPEDKKQESKDILLTSENLQEILNSHDLPLVESTAPDPKLHQNAINEPTQNQTKFSEFLKMQKEMLKGPNMIIKPQTRNNEDLLNKDPFKIKEVDDEDNEEDDDLYILHKGNKHKHKYKHEQYFLNARQTRNKKPNNRCSKCKKYEIIEGDDEQENLCMDCFYSKNNNN